MACKRFRNVIHLDVVDSTNTFLKNSISSFPDGTVVFANNQTAGRGKLDRKWIGKESCSIFCSFLTKDINSPLDAIRFNFKFSLIIKKVMQLYTDSTNLKLKWPNDILSGNNKKICGILSEYADHSVITGVGINIKPFETPSEINQVTDFLENISAEEINLELFQQQLIEEANCYFDKTKDFQAESFPGIWYNEARIADSKIAVQTGIKTTTGIITGITDYGALLILTDNNEKIAITTGDITYYD